MNYIYLFTPLGIVAGFASAWVIKTREINRLNKIQKSTAGFLESEKLMKETLQKENGFLHQSKQVIELESARELQKANHIIKILNEDILLLQKSNEETEAQLQAGQPELYELKIKLIEANNTIARYKALINPPEKK